MKKVILTTLLLASGLAQAHDNWISTDGNPVRNSTGLCWRNSAWTPATAAAGCDGALAPKAAVPQVITAPAPQPKPQLIKVTYSGDTFFDFDKSVIKPEGKRSLDALVEKIKNIRLEVVVAIGHTDNVGTDAYNMKLGQRRAEAVKAYLISKGIEPNRVFTESKGESQPVADNRTAQGRAKNRRVEVEVVGTAK